MIEIGIWGVQHRWPIDNGDLKGTGTGAKALNLLCRIVCEVPLAADLHRIGIEPATQYLRVYWGSRTGSHRCLANQLGNRSGCWPKWF